MAIFRWATLLVSIGVTFGLYGCGKEPSHLNILRIPEKLPPPVQQSNCNQVLNQCIDKSTSYYTQGGKIYHKGQRLHIKGVNWFGLDVSDTRLHGLWTGRSLESFVDQVKGLGFNAFRIPIAPEVLNYATKGGDGYSSARSQLERLLQYTREKGMYVLLDLHKCSKDNSHTDKPGPGMGTCSSYPVAKWTEDLREMARLSLYYDNVLGIDIFNEPYGFSWRLWRPLAERAGVEILRINPRLLVFVEGVGSEGYNNGRALPFWGENLSEVSADPVQLPASQLVYSPHVYGPSVAPQDYFEDSSFPYNMPSIWHEHFGYLSGNHGLVIGEFGGKFQEGKDQMWKNALVSYLKSNDQKDFFYWALNPNSSDTGGLLKDDWLSVDWEKYDAIKPLFY